MGPAKERSTSHAKESIMSKRRKEAQARKAVYAKLVGSSEKEVVDKIANYARDALIVDSIQRIDSDGSTVESVLQELQKYPKVARVCSAALGKLWSFIRAVPSGDYGRARTATARDIRAAGAFIPVLRSMRAHAGIRGVQVSGSHLMYWFLLPNEYTDRFVSDVLSSQGCVQMLLRAVQRFPDDVEVQEAVWQIMHPLQQACARYDRSHTASCTDLYVNLVEANALPLACSALERHKESYATVIGALTVIKNLAISFRRDRLRRALLAFARDRPDLRTLLDQVVETQSRIQDDAYFVRREATMVQMAFDQIRD